MYVPQLTLLAFVVSTVSAAHAPPKPCKLVHKPSRSCGVAGRAFHSDGPDEDRFFLYSPQIVKSAEECATLCARRVVNATVFQTSYFSGSGDNNGQDDYCRSLQFDTETNLCRLGRYDVAKRVNPAPKSPAIFYNIECFECADFCDQPLGAQLLDNGGFESKLLGPWAVVGATVAKGHNSRRAYRATSGGYITQSANLCPGFVYAIEFDYKIVVKNTTGTHLLEFTIGGYGPNSFPPDTSQMVYTDYIPTAASGDAWSTTTVYFRYLGGFHRGPAWNYFFVKGNGFLDNARLSRVPSAPPLRQPETSAFQNGDFESGDFGPWTVKKPETAFPIGSNFNSKFVIVSPGLSSSGYAVTFAAHGQNSSLTNLFTQKLATKPNKAYMFSCDLENSGPKKSKYAAFFATIRFGPAADQITLANNYLHGLHSVSMPIYAKFDSLEFSIQFRAEDQAFGNKITIDNFKLVEIATSAYFP